MSKAKAEATDDVVNKASHYNAGGIECIEGIKAALGPDGFRAWLRGTIIKYAWRMEHKGSRGLDAAKLAYYSRRLEQETKSDVN